MTVETILKTDNLSKSFKKGLGHKRVNALKALNLEVKKGEVLGIIGPNGAGKTTTFKLLLGLIKKDSGLIEKIVLTNNYIVFYLIYISRSLGRL